MVEISLFLGEEGRLFLLSSIASKLLSSFSFFFGSDLSLLFMPEGNYLPPFRKEMAYLPSLECIS